MPKNVGFMCDTISKEVSIDYETYEDLINCFLSKASEFSAVNKSRLCLVSSSLELYIKSDFPDIIQLEYFNEKLKWILVQNADMPKLQGLVNYMSDELEQYQLIVSY